MEKNIAKTTPDHIVKYTRKDPEQILLKNLVEKFGERYVNYRKSYTQNIQNKKFTDPSNYPTTVVLELVNRCNLECVMCYQGFRNKAEKSTIDLKSLEMIFKDFKDNQLSALMLSISEPLLYKDFDKVLELAKEANIMDILLFTNGTLLNKKNAQKILESSITRLFVSIDGATSDTYNKVRIPVSERLKDKNRLNDLENNIKNFIKMRDESFKELPVVRTSFVALDHNNFEMKKFIDKWVDIVDSVEVQRETSIKAYDDIRSGKFNIKGNQKDYDCSEPWGQVTVYSDGTVTPCCNTVGRNLPIGNISKNSLKEIWNGVEMMEVRKGFLKNDPSNVCKSCIENSQSELFKS
tara:strand:+ start:721 stop:1773 length:1053 start_codon:yes stop_codon:yes gene_type:complete